MRLLKLLILLPLLLVQLRAQATHLRAGEITYERIDDLQLRYRVTVTTWSDPSGGVDDPFVFVEWGDNQDDTISRTSIQDFTFDLRKNTYVATHLYSGSGTFKIQMEAQFRNGTILNMNNPLGTPLTLESILVVGNNSVPNNSVVFLNPPIQNACMQKAWCHNPVAVDPDGDSLSYEAVPCRGAGQVMAAGYVYPNGIVPGPDNTYSIDPLTGTICWISSQQIGEYNLAFIVHEWRNGLEVGSVLRDMQVTVGPCQNEPPEVGPLQDTCVVAGTTLIVPVTATDPDFAQDITLSALGSPLIQAISPATFAPGVPNNPANGTLTWNTDCAHVRLQPYQVVFNATDNSTEVVLEDYQSMFIRIVAPAPLNPSATATGLAIQLDWDPDVCTNATGYRIYRRSGSFGFIPDHCETGVPAYTGYVQIAGVSGWATSDYLDDDGLIVGNEYCYMVVATFADGSLSLASVEFCAILDRQVPVITHVSVGVTDVATGIDTVRWSNAYDMDTTEHPGPYKFKLYRGNGLTGANTLIHTSTLWPFLAHPDTTFLDLNLDTKTLGHVYRVELYGDNGTTLIGPSNEASSIFLVLEPNDEQITLHFEPEVPWVNSLYEVFKFDGVQWNMIGTSNTDSYVDAGLVNGDTYCYYVRSTGAYSLPSIVSPLINYSQEACGVPVDITPPCPPVLAIVNDCETPLNTLTWTNPNSTCADDTWMYNIWFIDSIGATYGLIATITGASDTTITHVDGLSVAGCYVVTAIDSSGNQSAYSNEVCGDNCPEYTLPNVFSPNGDLYNEQFVPFPYRGVERIDLTVFNRWGMVMFATDDPAIRWNGTNAETNEPVPDGVYFYTCTVTFKRLAGDELKQLNGSVQILRGQIKTD